MSRHRRGKKRHTPRFRPWLENLECRRLLSADIFWSNRGPDDNFNEAFGSRADAARKVVDQAILDWERVITAYNWSGSTGGVLDLEVQVDLDLTGCGAEANNFSPGLPLSQNGELLLIGEIIVQPCNGGAQYFFDATPEDSSEFLNTLVNAFAGTAPQLPSDAPPDAVDVRNLIDFLTMISHEIGHVLGMGAFDDVFLFECLVEQDPPFDDTGVPDASVDGKGTLWAFHHGGGGVEGLLTDNSGGKTGSDTNFPFHVAAPHPDNTVQRNGINFFGARDIMNPTLPKGLRMLPSLLTVRLLAEMYPFLTVRAPQQFGSFYAHLGADGRLLVRGGSTGETDDGDPMYPIVQTDLTVNSNDFTVVIRDNDSLRVDVTIGTPIPGTEGDQALSHRFRFDDIVTLDIKPSDGRNDPTPSDPNNDGSDDGTDIVILDFNNGNVIPPDGVSVDGGSNEDQLVIRNLPPGTVLRQNEQQIDLEGLGTITATNFERFLIAFESGSNQAVFEKLLTGTTELRVHGGTGRDDIHIIEPSPTLNQATITGGGGHDAIRVDAMNADLLVQGGDGSDTLFLGTAVGHLEDITGEVTFDGGNDTDTLILTDTATQSAKTYSIIATGPDTGEFKRSGRTTRYEDLEAFFLFGGQGGDEILVISTNADLVTVLDGGGGEDTFTVDSGGFQNDGNVNEIRSQLAVVGGSGNDTLTLIDVAEEVPNNLTITESTIGAAPTDTFFDPGGGHVAYGELETINVWMGQSHDTLNLHGLAAGTDLNVDGQAGNDAFLVGVPTESDGGADSEIGTASVDLLQGEIVLTGDRGSNYLQVNDSAAVVDKQATLTEDTLGHGSGDTLFPAGGALTYRDMFFLDVLLGDGEDRVRVESTHKNTVASNLYTGAGKDVIQVESALGNANLVNNLLTISGQQGDDELLVNDATDPLPQQVTVTDANIGAGTDDEFLGTNGKIAYSGIAELTIQAGSGDNDVLLQSTDAQTHTNLLGGDGSDRFFLENSGLVDQLRSVIRVDGQTGTSDRLQINNSADTGGDIVVLDAAQIGGPAGGTYFPAGGTVHYSGIDDLLVATSQADDTILVRSTSAGTRTIVTALGGNDSLRVDSNGLAAGGTVDGVAGMLGFFGGDDVNVVALEDADDPTGDQVTIEPISANTGHVGRAAGDNYFGGGRLTYVSVAALSLGTSATAADTVLLAPAPTPSGTVLEVTTSGPAGSDPDNVDQVLLDLTGVNNPLLTAKTYGAAQLISTSHAPVLAREAEVIDEVSGTLVDVSIEGTSPFLGGNDGLPDTVDVSVRQLASQQVVELQANGLPLFGIAQDVLRSLSIFGSSDDTNLVLTETPDGLPQFAAPAPLAQANAAFVADGRLPQHVGLYYDGGTGTGLDELTIQTITPQQIVKYDDTLGQTKSANVNIAGHLSLWYESLTPVTINAAGGELTIDARLLAGLTHMEQTQLADGSQQVTGDGGFETTIYRGLDRTATLITPLNVTPQQTYTVSAVGDDGDLVPGDGWCATADGSCTLRAAIEETNALALDAAPIIRFASDGGGPLTIQPATPLPVVHRPLVIDGSAGGPVDGTALPAGSSAVGVHLDGSRLDGESPGLVITAGASVVRGLAVTGFHDGLVLAGRGGNIVEGNLVGVLPDGRTPAGNRRHGLLVGSPNNRIGGLRGDQPNVVSANGRDGVHLEGRAATGNVLIGNWIGTAGDGREPLGNQGAGVMLTNGAGFNRIGLVPTLRGRGPDPGNTIAFNQDGVVVAPGVSRLGSAVGNTIRGNAIHSNQRLGIDLVREGAVDVDGPTPNDRGDADTGGNRLQNYPLLKSAVIGDGLEVLGRLDSTPDSSFVIDIYANQTPDESGFGEGERYLGSIQVRTDAAGRGVFRAVIAEHVTEGSYITATATSAGLRQGDDTSEFSPAVEVRAEFPRRLRLASVDGTALQPAGSLPRQTTATPAATPPRATGRTAESVAIPGDVSFAGSEALPGMLPLADAGALVDTLARRDEPADPRYIDAALEDLVAELAGQWMDVGHMLWADRSRSAR